MSKKAKVCVFRAMKVDLGRESQRHDPMGGKSQGLSI